MFCKQENATLREQNDELQAQLLHKHVVEGWSLLQSEGGSVSLASEIENLSKNEVHFCHLSMSYLSFTLIF